MGTTLTALQAGSMDYDLVIAIEGYPHLLTTGATAAAVTAWAGTDWSTALGGLYVDLQNEQTMNPWEPFQGGGKLTFHVADTGGDTFGIDVHCVAGNVKSTLTGTIDRAATAIPIQLGTNFAAATAEAFLGTECIEYSAKTGTSLTASKRGKYSPFAAGGTGSPRFAQHHRFGNLDYSPLLAPIVSQLPRAWRGKWIGLWMHRKVAGVLDVKAEALCLYAGKIDEPYDDPNTMMTAVSCTHVLDSIKDAVIGRDMWTAKITGGIYLAAGVTFTFTDKDNASGVVRTMNSLTVVPSGASGANQMNAGYYDVGNDATSLFPIFNTWWASELAANRCWNIYTFSLDENGGGADARVVIDVGGLAGSFSFSLPTMLAIFLGYDPSTPTQAAGTETLTMTYLPQTSLIGVVAPYRTLLFESTVIAGDQRIAVVNTSGTFVDNYAQMPAGAKPPSAGGLAWGLFLFDNKILVTAALVGNELQQVHAAPALMSGLQATGVTAGNPLFNYGRRYGQDDQGVIEIRQVYAFAQTFAAFWNSLMYSTGTAGYNDATYDVYGFGIGLGIPAELLAGFTASVAALDVATAGLQCIIDKPTKLSELLNVDLILRRTSLVWKNGALRMVSWSTPTTTASVFSLQESNKGEPPDTKNAQRSSSLLSADWIRNVVKIQYNRDAQTGDYLANVTLEDRTSIDDAGGDAAPITLPARNAFSDSANIGAGVQSLLPAFLGYMPFFSNAVRRLNRSIDSRLFETLAPGDIVTVTDSFARDPQTGIRGTVARPGIIVRVWYTLGGAQPGQPDQITPMSGEVDVIFIDAIVAARLAQYSPAAEVDSTASSSGFTAGYNNSTKTLRFLPHEHTTSPGGHDVDYFAAGGGDQVRILEVDPDDPASPLTWVRTTASHAGDDVVLTATLSSPAFDSTKRYRMVPDHFGACQASQQAKAFEAAATGLVESTTPPFEYSLTANQGFTAISHTELAEHHASLADGDGKPRDTGYDAALARTINNLVDHKTAHQSPSLDQSERANDSINGYVLTYMRKIFVGTGKLGLVGRALAVAPFFRSKTGASVTVRATLSANRPINTSYTGVTVSAPLVQASWSTTSTTYVTGAETLLDLAVTFNGWAWLMLEINQHAATRGFAQCCERERT